MGDKKPTEREASKYRKAKEAVRECLSRYREELKGPLFQVQILTLLALLWYAVVARHANDLTRSMMRAASRPAIALTVAPETFSFDDEGKVSAAIVADDTGKGASSYWEAGRIVFSTDRLKALWDNISRPARRFVFASKSDLFIVSSDSMGESIAKDITSQRENIGWLYVSVWVWYGDYRSFVCWEYKLPSLHDPQPCQDPNANYAD